jgi:nucleoside-diphosphate-sugar epimerase
MRNDLIRNNTEGTANIVNACLENKVKKLCHVSSTSALGEAPVGEMVSEDIIWTPDKLNSAYSISKFKSEMEVWRGIEEGLDAVIVNPGIIFGAGFWDKGSSSMFTNIKKGLRFYLKGVTAFIGVEDVVFCMMRLMNSDIKSQRFILVSENLSYQEVFTMIAKALNVRAPYIEPAPFLSALAWRFDSLRSRFGSQRVITRETINAGRKVSRFSNGKIKEFCGHEFTPVERVIELVAKKYNSTRL